MRRALLQGLAASALLVLGFLLYLQLAFVLERPADATAARELRDALSLYGRTLLSKALLPQLWLALPLALWLERRFPVQARSRAGLALVLALAALLAGVLVLPTLLRSELWGLPRVVFRGPGNFALTWIQTGAAVAAALWLPRRLWPAPR